MIIYVYVIDWWCKRSDRRDDIASSGSLPCDIRVGRRRLRRAEKMEVVEVVLEEGRERNEGERE